MSSNVDKTFRLINIITKIFLLQNIEFTKNTNGSLTALNKIVSIIYIVIRTIFIVAIWYSLFRRSAPFPDLLDIAMQLGQKFSSGLNLTITYITSHLIIRNIKKITKLMKDYNRWNCATWSLKKQNTHNNNKITSYFMPYFIVLSLIYIYNTIFEYKIFESRYWFLFSRDQFIVMEFGSFISVLMISIIYAISGVIIQQYKQLNNELMEDYDNDDSLYSLAKVFSELNEQCECLSAAFEWFVLCKFLATFLFVIITLFYFLLIPEDFPVYSIVWIGYLCGELFLIVYYCDQIQVEVKIYI